MRLKGTLGIFALVLAFIPASAGAFDRDEAARELKAALQTDVVLLDGIELPSSADRSFGVDVPLGSDHASIRFDPFNLRSPDFRLFVDMPGRGLVEVEPPAPQTLRGATTEGKISAVGSLMPEGLRAFIYKDDQNGNRSAWMIQPVIELIDGAPHGLHVVYGLWQDLPADPPRVSDQQANSIVGATSVRSGSEPRVQEARLQVARIAYDTDLPFVNLHGGPAGAIDEIESIHNAVSFIFARDVGVAHEIATIVVRDQTDPWNADPLGGLSFLFEQFEAYWDNNMQNIDRSFAHLMVGRTSVYTAGTSFSTFGRPCTVSGNVYSVNVPVFSSFNQNLKVGTVARSLGVNWGANFCESSSTEPCRIMCFDLNGCDGLGLPNFAPQSIDEIAARRDQYGSCLTDFLAEVPIYDSFELVSGGQDSPPNPFVWATLSGSNTARVRAPDFGPTPPNGPGVLQFFFFVGPPFGDIPIAETQPIDLRQAAGSLEIEITWAYFAQGGSGASLIVEIGDLQGNYTEVGVISASSTSAGYIKSPMEATPSMFCDEAVIRLTFEAEPFSADEFYIDDILITADLTGPTCPPDLNGDGVVDADDFFLFLQLFADGDPRADFNNDGVIDADDFFDFLAAFAAGC